MIKQLIQFQLVSNWFHPRLERSERILLQARAAEAAKPMDLDEKADVLMKAWTPSKEKHQSDGSYGMLWASKDLLRIAHMSRFHMMI